MKRTFCLLTLAIVLQGCSKPEEQPAQVENTASSELVNTVNTPAPPAASPSPLQQLLDKPTLMEAVNYLKPEMKDAFNSFPEAAGYLAIWSNKHGFKWKDLANFEETQFGRVLKDPDAERGKRICMVGSIVEIAADKTAGFTVYHAGLADNNMRFMRVLAVGSTGDLIAQSPFRFCGVVIGKVGFQNSIGGTTEAVYAVGVFDLPENR